MHRAERRKVRGFCRGIHLIFIIGPPRSGTTLTYQLLTEFFDVGYITNAHAKWYGGISYYQRIYGVGQGHVPSDYFSVHGRTNGSVGPSECGEYWYQFFPRTRHYVRLQDMNESSIRWIRNSMSRICDAFRKPVVFKNVVNSGRLNVLRKIFPDAVFVEVCRDFPANAASILRTRHELKCPESEWWSIRPRGYEAYNSAPEDEKVFQQIKLTREMIADDLKEVEPEKWIRVEYEELCRNPQKVISELETQIKRTIPSLSAREGAVIRKTFER